MDGKFHERLREAMDVRGIRQVDLVTSSTKIKTNDNFFIKSPPFGNFFHALGRSPAKIKPPPWR